MTSLYGRIFGYSLEGSDPIIGGDFEQAEAVKPCKAAALWRESV